MNDERQCCKCGDYHPLRRMEAKPSRDGWHTLYTCNVCAAMTATPSAAEQAEQWAKERYPAANPPQDEDGMIALDRHDASVDGYLAGHAAGEVAGVELERARICAWTEQESGNYAYTTSCGSAINTMSHYEDYEGMFVRCPFCGGRIQTEDR